MTVPVAHAGHWIVQLLYVLPLAVVGFMLVWQKLNDKREEREIDACETAPVPPNRAKAPKR